MAGIYQNASFTITATASVSGYEGLFRDQDPLSMTPCFLSLADLHDVSLGFGHSVNKPYYILPNRMNEFTEQVDIEVSPWDSRAWYVQERYLSNYIFYFDQNQVYTEVQNHVTSRDDDDHRDEACLYNVRRDGRAGVDIYS